MIKGTLLQSELPDWQPLLAVAGEPLVHQFMWMHELELRDGTRLHAFKHIVTRDYLHLCREPGAAYRYVSPNNYVAVDLAGLMTEVLSPMWEGGLKSDEGWVEAAQDAIAQVRARAVGEAA